MAVTATTIRNAWVKLIVALVFAVVLLFLLFQSWHFVHAAQNLLEKFKHYHSHVYEEPVAEDHPVETPYYGCSAIQVLDKQLWDGCQKGEDHVVVPDTPDMIFERCVSQMLVEVCPDSVAGNRDSVDLFTLYGVACHQAVRVGMRAVVFSQERILVVMFFMLEVVGYVAYLYFVLFSTYHDYMEKKERFIFSPTASVSTSLLTRDEKQAAREKKYGPHTTSDAPVDLKNSHRN